MAASVWTGYLTFGLISMPVRLFSGARSNHVSFHMLHRDDHVRVKQQLVCPEEDKVIGRDEIVKGYEFRKGEYVIIEPEELKKIEPKTAKAMEILEFVKADDIDPIYFESSYYLMPEEAGKRPYALLQKALEDSKHVVGVWKPKKAAPVVDLMDALKQSLAQMEGKKKGPQRAIDYQRENQVRISDEPQPSKKAVRKRKSA